MVKCMGFRYACVCMGVGVKYVCEGRSECMGGGMCAFGRYVCTAHMCACVVVVVVVGGLCGHEYVFLGIYV